MTVSGSRHQMPAWLSRSLLAGLTLIFVVMPVHAFISTWGGTAIGPYLVWKSWKEILLIVMLVPTLGWLIYRRDVAKQIVKDKLFVAVLAYAVLTLVMAAIFVDFNGLKATAAGVAINLRYLVAAALAYLVFRYGGFDWCRWRRYAVRFLLGAGTGVAVLGLLQVYVLPLGFLSNFGYGPETISAYTLIDNNPDAPRAFATLSGPNSYGAWLILPILLSLSAAFSSRWWLAGSLLMLAAVFESSSRSAWGGLVLALATLALLIWGVKWLKTKWGMTAAGLGVVALIGLGVASVTVPAVRLQVFHSSPSDPSLIEGSTLKHFKAIAAGAGRVAEQPLGYGPGYAGPASAYRDGGHIAENYYVQIAAEVGIIGLALWLFIAGIVAYRLYQLRHDWLAKALLASFVGLSAIGLLLHVWADDPVALTWWLLAGALLGAYDGKQVKQKIHRKRQPT